MVSHSDGVVWFFFFFFQAEDGIRDYKVTGVQTCALPISHLRSQPGRSVLRVCEPFGQLDTVSSSLRKIPKAVNNYPDGTFRFITGKQSILDQRTETCASATRFHPQTSVQYQRKPFKEGRKPAFPGGVRAACEQPYSGVRSTAATDSHPLLIGAQAAAPNRCQLRPGLSRLLADRKST